MTVSAWCVCDPTRGQSCRDCDGTAADEREASGWSTTADRRRIAAEAEVPRCDT